MNREKIIHAAIRAMDFAYCPYSKHAVGAVILGEDENLYAGCNIENASYGLTQCAERVAIGAMLTNGVRKWKAIAIASKKISFPCGACLQVLHEFISENAIVILVNSKGQTSEFPFPELLPHPFIS